jgi:sugar phosphate isomerase/epimerase
VQLGICTSVDNAGIIAAAGAAFVEEHIQQLLVPEQDEATFAPILAKVKASPLPVIAANCFLPPTLPCTGPNVDTARLLRYGDTAFRRAAQCGIRYLVFGSAGARKIPAGFSREKAEEQFGAILKGLAPLAQQHGVIIVVEPLHQAECNFINSLAEGAQMVNAANHPHVWLLADIFHMLRDNEPASEIIRFGHLLRHAHIAEKEKRTAPGVQGDDFRPYLRALQEINYTGALAIEASVWGNLAVEAQPALNALKGQLC